MGAPGPADSARRLSGPARDLTIELYGEARAEWAYVSVLIAAAFRQHRGLPSSDRRRVAESVYGLVRSNRRLDAMASEVLGRRRGKSQPLTPRGALELNLLLFELRQGVPLQAVRADFERLLGPGSAPAIAHVADDDAGLGNSRGIDRDGIRLSYPTWFLERLVGDLGEKEAFAFAEASNQRAPMCIRANSARLSREELRSRLADEHVVATPTALSGAGLILETRVNAFGLAAFREGLFEVMDEGSQLVAEAVAPPPGGHVLDACAGAGGKTLALGALLQGKGRILALDTNGKKLEELRKRARRAGLANVAARELSGPGFPPEAKPGRWDRVLVDVPCSGTGTLRRNPEARWRLTTKEIDSFPARQLALMIDYAPLVRVGGRLIYATCTVLQDENERVVERFLAERPDFVPFPLKDIFGKERATKLGDGMTLRISPHRQDTDGFFAAVLRRVR